MKFPHCCPQCCNWGEDFTLPVHSRSPFSQGCCQPPIPASLLHSPLCCGLGFFSPLAQGTFTCGDFHVVWVAAHPRFKLGLKPPGRGGKSATKPSTTNPDLFVLLVVTIFNMSQYWIIINSFCFTGMSLSHIKTPVYHRKSMFILKKRWGLEFGVFYHDVKSHKHKVTFSPPPSASSRS